MLPEGNLTLDSILEGILDEEQQVAPNNHSNVAAAVNPNPQVTIKTEQTTSTPNSSSSPTISSSAAPASSVSMHHHHHHPHPLDDIPCISIKTELPDSCTAAVDDIMVRRRDIS